MLVVNRKYGERILIGNDITVTVVRINGRNSVRLGIDAPPEMNIFREELLPVSKVLARRKKRPQQNNKK